MAKRANPIYYLDPKTNIQYLMFDKDTGDTAFMAFDPSKKTKSNPSGMVMVPQNTTLFLIGDDGEFMMDDNNPFMETRVAQVKIGSNGYFMGLRECYVDFDITLKKIKEGPDVQGHSIVEFNMKPDDVEDLVKTKDFDRGILQTKFINVQATDNSVDISKVNMLNQHKDGAEHAKKVYAAMEKKSKNNEKTRLRNTNSARTYNPQGSSSKTISPYQYDNQKQTSTATLTKTDKETIASFGRNLNVAAAEGKIGKVIGRDFEIDKITQILGMRKKNNPIIIGEAGVGKTAIAEHLANKLINNDIPDYLKGQTLIQINMSSIVAGTKFRGEFEERMELIIALGKKPGVILFIDEIHTLIGAGSAGEGTMDAANMLKAALASGEIKIIGATTNEEYRKHIEKDGALKRRFASVETEPTDIESTATILMGTWEDTKKHYGFTQDPTEKLFNYIPELAEKFNAENFEPDRSIGILDLAASIARNISSETIKEDHIQEAVSQMSNIPLKHIQTDDNTMYLNLEKTLNEKVIGQEHAIKHISNAMLVKKSGLSDQNLPVGFLATGPSGTGKTLTAKSIAKAIYGTEKAIVRINMAEYMEKHSIARLIGSPPGYVGFNGKAVLEEVRKNPHALVLFDEIEKADPDVLKILLQILDEGKTTLANGVDVSFKNATVMMTSNLGSREMIGLMDGGTQSGFDDTFGDETEKDKNLTKELKECADKAVKKYLLPEIVGRIKARGGIINYHPLDIELPKETVAEETLKDVFAESADKNVSANVRKITEMELEKVQKRFSSVQGAGFTNILLNFSDDVVHYVAANAYDRASGGRSIEPFIAEHITIPLGRWIMNNKEKLRDAMLNDSDPRLEINEVGLNMEPQIMSITKALVAPSSVNKNKKEIKLLSSVLRV